MAILFAQVGIKLDVLVEEFLDRFCGLFCTSAEIQKEESLV